MSRFEEEIHFERLDWFIRLRWGAVAGGVAILGIFSLAFPAPLPYPELLLCLGALGLLNAGYLWYWKGLQKFPERESELEERAGGLLHLQMFLDLLVLTLLLSMSGGVQNPLFLLYLFHLAISATVFSLGESFFYAALAACLPWVLHFTGPIGPFRAFPWTEGVTEGPGVPFLAAYSLAAAGLWFFLTRLARDLRGKEEKLRESGGQLALANEELHHLDAYKSHFLRQVVHRLKKPAVDMDFDLSEVERSLPGKAARSHEAVQAAKKRVWSLLELIEDLVQLSRMGEGGIALKKERFDLYDALLERVQAMEPAAARKGIAFKLHGGAGTPLEADRAAFELAIGNILSNAVKYTPPDPHGKASVTVEFTPGEGGIAVEVEDQGIGIPPKQQARLFQEFFRATNAKALEGSGTGLGLVLVKRVMDQHGGRVAVKSEPGKGTKVTTWWPVGA